MLRAKSSGASCNARKALDSGSSRSRINTGSRKRFVFRKRVSVNRGRSSVFNTCPLKCTHTDVNIADGPVASDSDSRGQQSRASDSDSQGPVTVPDAFSLIKQFRVVQGTIYRLEKRGAFVRLDTGVEGLLRRSQVSHHPVAREEFLRCFKVGDRIKVVVLQKIKPTKQLEFTTKCFEERRGDFLQNPQQVLANADSVAERLLDIEQQDVKPGRVVEGIVVDSKKYGAFVRVSKRQTGLLHISQISHDRVKDAAAIFKPGDRLKVMVASMDEERNRFILSTKRLEATPGVFLRDPQQVFDNAEATALAERLRTQANDTAAASKEGDAILKRLGLL